MIYFIAVHKDPDSSFGVTIPDIPGCFTAGDTIDEVMQNVQEAVECHLHDAEAVPKPTRDIDKLMSDPLYAGAIWIAVDVDMSFISGSRLICPEIHCDKYAVGVL